MHALLGLSSVALVVFSGYLALRLQRGLGDWSRRRDLQFLVLAAPVVSLAAGIGGLLHFGSHVCFLDAPSWDYTLGVGLPLSMVLIVVGGTGLGLLRVSVMDWAVARRGDRAAPELQALAARLAGRLGIAAPDIRVCCYDRPLALTLGLFRPAVLLSSWMTRNLDQRELEAVLAHELGHVARRDYPVVWLATVLRDAFFYLPTSWAAYRQLQCEKELACDDIAVGLTGRPLALASALAKVWQQALHHRQPVTAAQPLVGAGTAIEARIERLLARRQHAAAGPLSRRTALGLGALAVAGLVAVQAVNFAVMLAPMGCGPVWML